jgi:hypothetical protein
MTDQPSNQDPGGVFIEALMIVMELTTNVFGTAALQQF